MKLTKRLLNFLAIAFACLSIFSFAIACVNNDNNKNDNNDNPDENSTDESRVTCVFEAEDTDLSGKKGAGYSGSAVETDLIAQNANCGASNGRFLTYLYKKDLSIDFEVNSTEDVNGVTLVVRLSCEMQDTTITPDIYTIQVTNQEGKTVKLTYETINLKWSGNKGVIAQFKDYTISTKVKLYKGINTISLITSNSVALGGTAAATAPMLDCIKLIKPNASTAVFSMEKANNY